jgi:TonB-linked SusC/RagA family outer membrane protein
MKKNFDFCVYTHPILKKLTMQLKIAFIISLTCVTNILATPTYSQTAKVSLDMQSKSLEQVMDEIEVQSEFYFIFNQKQIDVNKIVDIHVENELITDILPELFSGTNVNYAVFDRKILLTTDALDKNLFSSESRSELQQVTVKGTIRDAATGDALPGVNIVLKGTTVGVISDINGSFSVSVPNSSASLQFSFIGYITQEVALGGRTTLDILMISNVEQLEEVVVVGYGTQKKINLTGAIASTSTKELAARASTNASDLLQGRISGLEIIQPTGQPGRDDAVMKVRGLGSFGASSNPLVLVDGVIGSLSNLAPNDIESVTVLKDAASASIYGARAANGVILVITKHAQKGASLEYQVDVSSQSATRLPDLVTNSADYMEFYNAARTRAKQAPLYTPEEIASYRNATDRNQYPNFDWMDYYFNPAQSVNHYLAFSNVTDRSTFKASFNYLNQDGILPDINFKKYNFSINATNQLTKRIKVGAVVSAFSKLNHEPPGWDVTGALAVYQAGPNYKPTLPDGSGRLVAWAYPKEGHNATSPCLFSGENGERLTNNWGMNSQLYLDVDLIKGMKWTTKVAYNYTTNKIKDHISTTNDHYYYFKLPGETDYSLAPVTSPSSSGGVTDQYQVSTLPTVSSVLNYETQFGGVHNLRAMVGFEQQSYYYQYVTAKRATFPTTALSELNAGSATGSTNGGSAYEWAIRGFFGRLGYDFQGKYLIELDARYDGTSRVAEANRWGFFPSLSAGWRISEENFIKNNVTWLDNLKLRGSYGILGNQEIGNYPYQDILSLSSYGFASGLAQTVHYTRLTDQNLRWESTKILDFGLDMDMSKGLFGFTFDWFKKDTYDILTTLPVPASLGISGPVTNDGELQNIGYELELRHRNQIGEVTYDLNFMVSHYENKLMKIAVPTTGVNEVGLPYNSIFVYEFNGVFNDQADIDNSPTQVFKVPQPGDVKVKDQNKDGVVDAKDRISLTPYPKYTYSFGFNVGWHGFNLSTFFQGVRKLNTLVYGWGIDPFVQMDPPNVKYYDSWSPENPTSDIPAVWLGSGGTAGNNGYLTTYHVPDASYLRLKNINLSYTLPKHITDKIRLQELTVILSGDNVLTFTKFPGIDPELPSQSTRGSAYPQITIYNIGLRVKF